MSVREEDRRKNNCPSRGLGLAAAAIGVGVGAALYYFFSKRPENPDSEGSTSQEWSCEQPQTFDFTSPSSVTSDYTTITEHTTTDTSVHDDSFTCINDSVVSVYDSEDTEMSDEESCVSVSDPESSESEEGSDSEEGSSELDSNLFTESDMSIDTSFASDWQETGSDSEMNMEWDVTNSSMDLPDGTSLLLPSLISRISDFISPIRNQKPPEEDDQIRLIREKAFRERKWSLEECSICFEVMLKDQPLMALPCTHNFHVACIGPWLEQQQTCPVCRKAAE